MAYAGSVGRANGASSHSYEGAMARKARSNQPHDEIGDIPALEATAAWHERNGRALLAKAKEIRERVEALKREPSG